MNNKNIQLFVELIQVATKAYERQQRSERVKDGLARKREAEGKITPHRVIRKK